MKETHSSTNRTTKRSKDNKHCLMLVITNNRRGYIKQTKQVLVNTNSSKENRLTHTIFQSFNVLNKDLIKIKIKLF